MENLLASVSLRRLQVFLTVCDTLHVARAAERLGVAQPALSQQIRGLEEALGVRLFNRRKRGIDLTAAGELCRAEAQRLLGAHAGLVDAIRRTGRGEMGRINLGYVASAMVGRRFPAQLKVVCEAFPALELSLRQNSLPVLVGALEAGELDIALICAPVAVAPPLIHRVHSRQELVVVLPADHPLAEARKIAMSALCDQPMIGLSGPDDIGVMQIAFGLATEAGKTLTVRWQVPEFTGVLGLVAAGLGYGLVPEHVARMAGPEIVWRPLETPGAHIEYWLVWHAERATPALHRVADLLLNDAA